MAQSASSGVLRRLRLEISRLEARPPLAAGPGSRPGGTAPWAAPWPGRLHEVWTASPRDAGTGLGFALGLARPLLSAAQPLLLWLQLRHEGAETGILHGAGLAAFGLDPASVVIGRLRHATDLLWCAEEALGARGVAAVLADIAGDPRPLDFTATRRLALRAAASGAAMLLIRYGEEHPVSAAHLRWAVAALPAAPRPFDDRAAGPPRFSVTLERAAQGWRGNWQLEWTHDGFVEIGSATSPREAPSRAVVPLLGDRLSRSA